MRLKRHSPASNKGLVAQVDSSPSAGYMMIHPIPSALQFVCRKVSLLRLYRAKTGDDVIDILITLNKVMRIGVHASSGISILKYFFKIKPRRGLIRTSK